jgi:protein SCO1/2
MAAAPGAAPPLGDLLAFVRRVRAEPGRRDELLPLLREDAAIYAGRGTGEAERLRGFIMASFAATGLPDAALPLVLEELETGRNPYALAAAARAMRGAAALPAGVEALIERAIARIRGDDDYVDFDDPAPPTSARDTTAVAELEAALATLTPRPACCAREAAADPGPALGREQLDRLRAAALEDQDGRRTTLGDLLRGRAGLVTFFYTRCMNPEKCALTISKLAGLRARIEAAGLADRVALAALSYDPGYDLPERLGAYGAARGLAFGDTCRLLRTIGPFEPLRGLLGLGVGYGEATVNRHRIELLVLRPDGSLADHRTRRLWDVDEMFAALAAGLSPAA